MLLGLSLKTRHAALMLCFCFIPQLRLLLQDQMKDTQKQPTK